ncbi:MAG: hypothetical protein CM15mP49_00180 [Actinomycetota bacterium]|nr:MAG: hypothetical protein CM15mP49_00180 [Actinomycetota bacterium]
MSAEVWSKINFTPEFFVAPVLSRSSIAGEILSNKKRSHDFMYHGRAQEQEVSVAFDNDGKIQALKVLLLKIWVDMPMELEWECQC